MKIMLEIPDEKAAGLMEVLNDISYVKTTSVKKDTKKKSRFC
ncbi:MAG TPA: hypothetical protein PK191_09045 [Niabella sp.]|nr:hypothetical protein [Niabella sp.]HOZ97974.1 hypothetical protein [Niabella sp.]HQW14141.1 hypothetical protein [Niabella sp.]HQX19540.1 hypothetical protein [Niabella sp.]HQX40025.1 hypothetical protein [Niabella sp.]